jgi:hypothetical protein
MLSSPTSCIAAVVLASIVLLLVLFAFIVLSESMTLLEVLLISIAPLLPPPPCRLYRHTATGHKFPPKKLAGPAKVDFPCRSY